MVKRNKPGPKQEQWKVDSMQVAYFVWRCLHDDEGGWRHRGYSRIADLVWDCYSYRLTEREFDHLRALRKSLIEFRAATRKREQKYSVEFRVANDLGV
jgi:hypothetical protein